MYDNRTGGVDANLFDMPDGSSVAVLVLNAIDSSAGELGVATHPPPPPPPRAAAVTVTLGKVVGMVESLQVGREAKWTAVQGAAGSTVAVSVEAGIAMLRITK